MGRNVLLLFACIALLVPVGWVALQPSTPERLSAESLQEFLALPLPEVPIGPPPAIPTQLGEALLRGPAVEHADHERVLTLGEVSADPTPAHLAALAAGELLRLPASDGAPLWKHVLEGPAVEHTEEGRALRLYGCRHSADPAAHPGILDSYTARKSIAEELLEITRSRTEYADLSIEGVDFPVKGGANFEVQLSGEHQLLQYTVDHAALEPLLVQRSWRPSAPNDDAARTSFVRGLRAFAALDGSAPPLRIEGGEAAVPGGLVCRLESVGGLQTLTCTMSGSEPIVVRRRWSPPEERWRAFLFGGGALAAALVLLAFTRPGGSRRREVERDEVSATSEA